MNGQHFPSTQCSRRAVAVRALSIMLFMATVILTSGCSTITAVFGMEATEQETNASPSIQRTLKPTPTSAAVENKNKDKESSEEKSDEDANQAKNSDNNDESENNAEESTAVALAKPESAASEIKGVNLVVTGDSVNVRNGPGLDAAIITAVPKGTIIKMLGKNKAGDWYEICCVQNQSGWIFAQLVKIQEGEAPPAALKPATGQEGAATLAAPINSQPAAEIANRVQPAAVDPDWSRYEYYENGLALSLPPTWKPQNWDNETWKADLDLLAKDNADLAELLDDQAATLGDVELEIVAFDFSPNVLEFDFATNVNIVKQYMLEGMSLDLFTRLAIREIKKALKPEEITREQVQLDNGPAERVQYELNMTPPTKSSADPIQLTIVQYLVTNAHTGYIITFTTPTSQLNEYAATFEQIAGSFEVLE